MKEKRSLVMLILSMCIFGTIGVLRKYIPLPSGMIALARAAIGAVFLLLVCAIIRRRLQVSLLRKLWLPLIASGAALGFNWIALFESYNHTSVANATICYYLAPVLVILVSPLVLKEKLTLKKALCAAAALIGMVLVSGIPEAEFQGLQELKGIGLGLCAAALYACVILLNKKLGSLPAFDKTIAQLAVAAVILLPYTLIVEDAAAVPLSSGSILLLVIAGIVHTGAAYLLYFGSLGSLKAQSAAIFSYLDPVISIVLSVTVLSEPMNVTALIGGGIILGAAFVSET